MKHYFKSFSILFLLLLFTFTYSYSQEFDWEWAVSPNGSGADVASATYTDAEGNVYVTGNFRSSTLTIGSFTLSKEGETDIFFAKYNPEGEVVWAKSFGGSHADGGIGISGDADGNVYLAAYFNSDIVFIGGLEAMNAGMESTDFFLAKFDGDGNEIWVQSGGGTGNDSVLDLITDADGNSYLTGYFFSSTMKVGSITLNNSGNTDIFVVKYNNEGVAQ